MPPGWQSSLGEIQVYYWNFSAPHPFVFSFQCVFVILSAFWNINFHCQSSMSYTNWFTLQRQGKELPTSHQRLEICRLLVLSDTCLTLRWALLVFSFRDRPLLWLQGKIPCGERQSAAPVLAKRWVAPPIKQQQRWDHFFLHQRALLREESNVAMAANKDEKAGALMATAHHFLSLCFVRRAPILYISQQKGYKISEFLYTTAFSFIFRMSGWLYWCLRGLFLYCLVSLFSLFLIENNGV